MYHHKAGNITRVEQRFNHNIKAKAKGRKSFSSAKNGAKVTLKNIGEVEFSSATSIFSLAADAFFRIGK